MTAFQPERFVLIDRFICSFSSKFYLFFLIKRIQRKREARNGFSFSLWMHRGSESRRLFRVDLFQLAEIGQAVDFGLLGLARDQGQAVVHEVAGHAVVLRGDPFQRDLLCDRQYPQGNTKVYWSIFYLVEELS